jgi:hypothetical protein
MGDAPLPARLSPRGPSLPKAAHPACSCQEAQCDLGKLTPWLHLLVVISGTRNRSTGVKLSAKPLEGLVSVGVECVISEPGPKASFHQRLAWELSLAPVPPYYEVQETLLGLTAAHPSGCTPCHGVPNGPMVPALPSHLCSLAE